MGRIFPSDYYHHHHYTAFPLLSLSLFVLSIATTLSIVTALCGFLSRKEEEVVVLELEEDTNNGLESPPSNTSEDGAAAEGSEGQSDDGVMSQPLPPPPAMRSASYHYRSSSQASSLLASPAAHKKLVASMSMKVGGQGTRHTSKKDDVFAGGVAMGDKKRDKKLKHEDSVWKKTIILGEKCRVHHDSEEEIVLDEDGNRITPYRPKTSAAPPSMSRQSSAVDVNVQKMDEGDKGI
nr:Phosphatidylinositol 3,4,5-trisphosphate 5-phosphatase [Ipomoea batatas]GMD45870.1 Phosphatidylinositol 3,4,5-trisphosphate 5-phosphatase [Ipomoea batatas]